MIIYNMPIILIIGSFNERNKLKISNYSILYSLTKFQNLFEILIFYIIPIEI